MLRSGLVSITFRQLAALQVIELAAACQLEGIEWGSDVHVPVGDLAIARQVGQATRDAGLTCAAYGSYYRLGVTDPATFAAYLDTAGELGTSLIRVWVGEQGSADCDCAQTQRVYDDAARAAELAAAAGLALACEWHGKTLTDTAASAAALFKAVPHAALKSYWQPHQRMAPEACLVDMDTALPRLVGVHVFEWDVVTVARKSLVEGAAHWPGYLRKAAANHALPTRQDLFALLEFVRDNDPAQLAADARTLRQWIAGLA